MSGTQKRFGRFAWPTILLSVVVAAALTLTSCDFSRSEGAGADVVLRDTTPVVLEVSQPGTAVVAEDAAILDYSNAAEGYICVMSNLPDTKIKVLVDVAGIQYQYTIDNAGAFITIPLSEGNDKYSVGVWQNVTGDTYAAVFSHEIDVVLNDEFGPFLFPSQFVSFAEGDAATTLSGELAEGSVTDVDVVDRVYRWVCENIDYDTAKATTVASGYLPDNTETLNSRQGICFDYAVLTASMLRAQRVPTKLVIGYAGTAYHAWIQVYSVDTGTVLSYTFNGSEWVLMDPTFDAASGGTTDLSSFIGNGEDYRPMFHH